MHCKICNYDNVIKAGISHGKQRYKCKDCAVHFRARTKRLSESERMRVVRLCSYGVSMNMVARLFYVSVTTVARWMKQYKYYLDKRLIPYSNADWLFAKRWRELKPSSKSYYVSLFMYERLQEKIQKLPKC